MKVRIIALLLIYNGKYLLLFFCHPVDLIMILKFDNFLSICVCATCLHRMPKTEELFGQCLIPMTYTPKINEMFAYKFNEIHVGRAIRLDPNGKNVVSLFPKKIFGDHYILNESRHLNDISGFGLF